MSRRVPRTLRTLKLDYREIAALLLFPPASLLSLSLSPSPRCSPLAPARLRSPLLGPPRASLRPPPSPSRIVPRVRPVVGIVTAKSICLPGGLSRGFASDRSLCRDGIVFVCVRELRYVGILAPRACASQRRRCVRVRRACLHHLRS